MSNGWKPIQTAPRDGRKVIVWIDDKGYKGTAFANLWFYVDGTLGGGITNFNGPWNVTHWREDHEAPPTH